MVVHAQSALVCINVKKNCCDLILFTVHGFAQATYEIDEGGGVGSSNEVGRLDTQFGLNVKGTTRFAESLQLLGTITAKPDGTARE